MSTTGLAPRTPVVNGMAFNQAATRGDLYLLHLFITGDGEEIEDRKTSSRITGNTNVVYVTYGNQDATTDDVSRYVQHVTVIIYHQEGNHRPYIRNGQSQQWRRCVRLKIINYHPSEFTLQKVSSLKRITKSLKTWTNTVVTIICSQTSIRFLWTLYEKNITMIIIIV